MIVNGGRSFSTYKPHGAIVDYLHVDGFVYEGKHPRCFILYRAAVKDIVNAFDP
jgi:hypothetical protein